MYMKQYSLGSSELHMRKHLLIGLACSVVLAFSGITAAGQVGQIRGRVLLKSHDGTTTPAPAAVIDAYRTDKTGHYEARTDEKGKFSLIVPFSGTFIIAVSLPGARPAFQDDIKGGRGSEYDFVLLPGDGRRLTSIEDIEALLREGQRQQAELVAAQQAQARLRAEEDEQRFAAALARKKELLVSMSPDALSSARIALKSLRKIAGATEIGVTKQEYSSRLIDVKADVDEAIGVLPDNQIEEEMKLAMEAFVDAARAWNEMITNDFLLPQYEPGATYQKKYSIPVDTSLGAGKEILMRETVLTKMWQAAKFHIDRASRLLN
jgi:hypothetical protein